MTADELVKEFNATAVVEWCHCVGQRHSRHSRTCYKKFHGVTILSEDCMPSNPLLKPTLAWWSGHIVTLDEAIAVAKALSKQSCYFERDPYANEEIYTLFFRADPANWDDGLRNLMTWLLANKKFDFQQEK